MENYLIEVIEIRRRVLSVPGHAGWEARNKAENVYKAGDLNPLPIIHSEVRIIRWMSKTAA